MAEQKRQEPVFTLAPHLIEGKILAEMAAHVSDNLDAQGPDGGDATWINKVEQIMVAFKTGENIAVHRLALQHLFDTIPSLNTTIEGKTTKEQWLDILMGMSNPGFCLNPATAHMLKSFYFHGFLFDDVYSLEEKLITAQDLQKLYDCATNPQELYTLINSWQHKDFFATNFDTMAKRRYSDKHQQFAFECLKLLQEQSITGNCLTSLADSIALAPLQEIVFEVPNDQQVFLKDARKFRDDFRHFLFNQKVLFTENHHLRSTQDLLKQIGTFLNNTEKNVSSEFTALHITQLKEIIKAEPLVLENLYSEITQDYQPTLDALPNLLTHIDLYKEWVRLGKPIETIRYDAEQKIFSLSFSLSELKKDSSYTRKKTKVDTLLFRYLQQKNMTSDILLKLSIPLGEADEHLKKMLEKTRENAGVSQTEVLSQKKVLRALGTHTLVEFLVDDEQDTYVHKHSKTKIETVFEKKQLAADVFDQLRLEVLKIVKKNRSPFLNNKKDRFVIAFANLVIKSNPTYTDNKNTVLTPAEMLTLLNEITDSGTKSTILLNSIKETLTSNEQALGGCIKTVSELFDSGSKTTTTKDQPYSKTVLRNMGLQHLTQHFSAIDRVISFQHGWGASEEVFSHRMRQLIDQHDQTKRTLFVSMVQGGAHNTNYEQITGEAYMSDLEYEMAQHTDDPHIRIKLSNTPKDSFKGYAQNMLAMEKALGFVAKPTVNFGHSMGGRIVLEKMLLVVSQHQHLLQSITSHAEAPVLLGNQEGYQLLFDPGTLKDVLEEAEQIHNLRELLRAALRGSAASINALAMNPDNPLPQAAQEALTQFGKKTRITDQIFRLLVRNAPESVREDHKQQLDYRESHLENQTRVLMNATAVLESEAQLLQALGNFVSISLHRKDQVLKPNIGLREALKIGGHMYETPTLKSYLSQVKSMQEKLKVLVFPKTTHYGDGHVKGNEGTQITADTIQVLAAEIDQLMTFSEQIQKKTIAELTVLLQQWAYDEVFNSEKAVEKPLFTTSAILES